MVEFGAQMFANGYMEAYEDEGLSHLTGRDAPDMKELLIKLGLIPAQPPIHLGAQNR